MQRPKFSIIAGLHPRSPRHFTRQSSVRVSQTLRPSYLCHVIPAATSADQYWHPSTLTTETHWSTHTRIRAFCRLVTLA